MRFPRHFVVPLLVLLMVSTGLRGEKLKASALIVTPTEPGFMVEADVNGDGKADIVYTDELTNNLVVQFGNGDGTFGAPIVTTLNYLSLDVSTLFTVADVNGDGKPDIVYGANLSNSYTAGLVVLPGNGDGTFGSPIVSPVETLAVNLQAYLFGQMGVADLNGDGKPDVVIGDFGNRLIYSLRGDGTGHFTLSYTYTLTGFASRVVLVDLNGDGKPDYVVQEGQGEGIAVARGNGDGSFGQPAYYTSSKTLESFEVGDVTGDGIPDLVVTQGDNSIGVLQGTGTGAFSPVSVAATYAGQQPVMAGLQDMNGDGKLDVVVASNNGISVLLASGAGTFAAPLTFSAGPDPYFNSLADFNGDGKTDVLASGDVVYGIDTYSAAAYGMSLLTGTGDGTLVSSDAYDAFVPISDATAGDLQGNGLPDLLVGAYSGVVTFGNLGNNNFGPVNLGGVLTADVNGIVPYVFPGDVNGDGKADALFTNGYQLGNGSITLGAPESVPEAVTNPGDFNGDGILDYATVADSIAQVYLGSESGFKLSATIEQLNYPLAQAATGDFDNDGKLDLLLTDDNLNVYFVRGNGDGTFKTPSKITATLVNNDGGAPAYFFTGDLDGDGNLDIIQPFTTGYGGSTGGIEAYYGNGDGTFENGIQISKLPYIANGAITDFNLDGKPDLIVNDGAFLYVLHGLGNRTYGAPVMYSAGIAPYLPHIVDVNNDGSPDVVIGDDATALLGYPFGYVQAGSVATVMLNRGGDRGTLVTDPAQLVYGETGFSIDATVTETVPGSGTPSGTVAIAVDSVTLGNATLAEMVAGSSSGEIADDALLSAGNHTVAAHYPGDGNFNPKSFGTTETISQATSFVTVTATPATLVVGQSLGLAATVTPEYSGVPTGTVTFNSGSTQLASGALNAAAMASGSVSSLTAGNYSVTAIYDGDTNFIGSTSSVVPVSVTDFSLSVAPTSVDLTAATMGTTTLALSAVNGFAAGVNLTCSAPSQVTCSVGTGALSGAGTTSVTVARPASADTKQRRPGWPALALVFPAFLVVRRRSRALMVAAIVIAIAATGCGGGSGGGSNPPPNVYTVTVLGTLAADSAIARTTTFKVSVPAS